MRSQNDALEPQVFFSDGAAISAESIAVCGGFTEAPEAAVSRIYLKLDATWLAHDVDKDFIVSVAYRDGVLFAVGRNGLVKTVGVRGSSFIPKNVKGRFRSYQVRECDDHGHLARVRAIGDDFFACGWGGQVYRLANDSYQKVDQGIDSLRDDTFLDIGGSTSNDIYAVGMDGLIAHFDGRRWSYLDSPTNNHLFSMRCLSSAEIVVVGANGTLLHGNKKGWQSLGDDAPREAGHGVLPDGRRALAVRERRVVVPHGADEYACHVAF